MRPLAKSLAEDGESLMASWNRDPEKRRTLLLVGVAAPVVITLWAWSGKYVMVQPAVLLVTAVLIALYGATMAMLSGSLVKGAKRWEMESAAEARRLVGDRRPGHSDGTVSSAESDGADFHHMYFLFRLRDAVKAARRTGSAMSVVVLRLAKPGSEPSPSLAEEVAFDVARLAADHVHTFSTTAAIGQLEYAFCLPEKDHKTTRELVHQLVGALGGYWSSFGIAAYPEDGSRAEELLEAAREQADNDATRAARAGSGQPHFV